MSTMKQAVARRAKMSERAEHQRLIHFSGVDDAWIWNRKKNHGFSTVPRTLPIVMQVADEQSKGQPPGHVLFCLWARAPDHPVLVIDNPVTFAAEAGFTGPRAVDTWRRRMKRLQELHLIVAKPGPAGDFHYVLLTNPNAAVEFLRTEGKIQDVLYGRFWDRLSEVGGIGEIDAIRAHWAKANAKAEEPPPPPLLPPPPPSTDAPNESALTKVKARKSKPKSGEK
ncbi:hypothetical protein H8M10_11795 [Stenotrophomonas maltophilia]|uniref:hypothetical protein n=1 Tax=Stenotrophomonas maltophilia TaxID=40324 RepID=UPI00163AA1F4|nr:hypothetical protein [Stenotrophomonas maltophilia]MBK1557701.1 hypothetical protein [Stenotrophomonas maltophilia]